jgi:hypothetical protein
MGSGLASFLDRSSGPDRSSSMRRSISARYSASRSIKTHRRPSMKLAAPVVPVPANGSKTVAPFGQTKLDEPLHEIDRLNSWMFAVEPVVSVSFASVEKSSGAAGSSSKPGLRHPPCAPSGLGLAAILATRSAAPASTNSRIRKSCHHFGRAIVAEIGGPAA